MSDCIQLTLGVYLYFIARNQSKIVCVQEKKRGNYLNSSLSKNYSPLLFDLGIFTANICFNIHLTWQTLYKHRNSTNKKKESINNNVNSFKYSNFNYISRNFLCNGCCMAFKNSFVVSKGNSINERVHFAGKVAPNIYIFYVLRYIVFLCF